MINFDFIGFVGTINQILKITDLFLCIFFGEKYSNFILHLIIEAFTWIYILLFQYSSKFLTEIVELSASVWYSLSFSYFSSFRDINPRGLLRLTVPDDIWFVVRPNLHFNISFRWDFMLAEGVLQCSREFLSTMLFIIKARGI